MAAIRWHDTERIKYWMVSKILPTVPSTAAFLRRIDHNTINRRRPASKAQERRRNLRLRPILLWVGGILLDPHPERDRSKTQATPDESWQKLHYSDAHDPTFRSARIQWNGMITGSHGSGAFPSAAMVVIGGEVACGTNRADP